MISASNVHSPLSILRSEFAALESSNIFSRSRELIHPFYQPSTISDFPYQQHDLPSFSDINYGEFGNHVQPN